jgi:hypothetical protein
MARTQPSPDRTFRHKQGDPRLATHESIAGHIDAFQSAGGRIEVLGTTHVLKKIDPEDAASPPQPAR